MVSKQIFTLLLVLSIALVSARHSPLPVGPFPDEEVHSENDGHNHQVRSVPSYARVSRNTDMTRDIVQVAQERSGGGGGKKGGITGFGFEGNGVDLTVGPALRYAKYYYNPFAYGGPYSPPVYVPIYGPLPNLEGPSLSIL